MRFCAAQLCAWSAACGAQPASVAASASETITLRIAIILSFFVMGEREDNSVNRGVWQATGLMRKKKPARRRVC
jgi:basic membrane lipoprotein Med (substrate-binding protein (PBP1-ABC) superfamily)